MASSKVTKIRFRVMEIIVLIQTKSHETLGGIYGKL